MSRQATKTRSEIPVKLIAVGDIANLFGIAVLGAISWVLPESRWLGFCRAVGRFNLPMMTSDVAATLGAIDATLGARDVGAEPKTIAEQAAAEELLGTLQLMRDYRPGGWRPETRVEGGEHIDAALADGHGAILWVGQFVHGKLGAKVALHRAGYAASHLSHLRHGFSPTRFGRHVLNAVRRAVEDRYLAERVLLSDDGAGPALDVLKQRLAENRIVTITVGARAARPVTAPFMAGEIHVAPGAPVLAYGSGAALLPVFPLRTASGRITAVVGPPITIDGSVDRASAVAEAVRDYAARLEDVVAENPSQWLGWFDL